MDHWLEFYAHYRIKYRKELREMHKYFKDMTYISSDVAEYIELFLNTYESFIYDTIHLSIFREDVLSREDILEYKNHLSSFFTYMDTNAKVHDLKAVHKWFMEYHKEDLRLLMDQLPTAASSTESATSRRIICGNLLLDFIDRFLSMEVLVIKKNNEELDAIRHHMKNEKRCDIISSADKSIYEMEKSAHI